MALPQMIQAASSAQNITDASALLLRLSHPCLAGNCMLVAFQVGAVIAPTVADTAGNTYTQLVTVTSNQTLFIFGAFNISADTGPTTVTITFHSSTTPHYSGTVVEFCNVATASAGDGTASNNGSSTTADGGTITTTVNGDLIYAFMTQETDNAGTHNGTSRTPATGWFPIHNDLSCGTFSMWTQQGGAGAITSSVTFNPGTIWVGASVALKTASAGTARPAGVRVIRRQAQSALVSPLPQPWSIQMPCEAGSTIAGSSVSANANVSDHSILRIADTSPNTWTLAKKNPNGYGGNRGDTEIWYASNVRVPSAGQLTLNYRWVNAIQEVVLVLYELQGINAYNPIGASYEATGNQAAAGNLTAGVITPATADGIVLAVLPIDIGAVTGCATPATYVFDTVTFPEGGGGFNVLEEDNGRAHVLVTSTSTLTFVWTNTNPVGGVGDYAIVAAQFMAGVNPGHTTLTNRGTRPAAYKPGVAR
jgi:hypothetical protein